MTVHCANGHASEADDYCDTCGEPIGAATPVAPPPEPEPAPPAIACPTCGFTAATGALFCENCGYDFTTGTSSEPASSLDLPPLTPATPPTPPAPSTPPTPAEVFATDPATDPDPAPPGDGEDPASAPVPSPAPGTDGDEDTPPTEAPPADPTTTDPGTPQEPTEQATTWVVELWIDPEWYAIQESTEPLPAPGPPSQVVLRSSDALVGRHSSSRGIHPEIDCGRDSGVSRRHCRLTSDGHRWWVEDLQSSNGTYAGPGDGTLPTDPIAPGVRREIEEGDRIYLGAFTRLVLREALPGEA